MISALGLLLLVPAAASATGRPCNGSTELCDRTLDQVVLPGTHNSMSNSESGWLLPNQTYSISDQLEMGVRALLFDTHYGAANLEGKIVKIPKSEGRVTHAQTFLCHEYCQLGAVDLTEELGRIKDFLVANPREVFTFINQDGISPEDFATAVTNSGLLPYVYQGPVTTFPTLGQMVDSGQRIVMLAEQESAGVPWYHNAYDGAVMETPYDFKDPNNGPYGGLVDPEKLNETCKPNRGSEGAPLFLMNHWVTTGVTPDINKMAIVNTKEALVARARACETRRGKLPNILAVDFFGTGDLLGATRELNGVVAKPYLEVTPPKAATVKAKRKATYRFTVSNFGDAEATNVKICATVNAGLAFKPRCSAITSIKSVNGSGMAQMTVLTKKRYRKGKGNVKFSVYSSQPTITSMASLTVKPLKKPKKHRKRG